MKIFLLVGIYHLQPQHQGQKGVSHVPPGGLEEHSQSKMGYISGDSVRPIDKDFFIDGDVPPTAPAPGTKTSKPCAS